MEEENVFGIAGAGYGCFVSLVSEWACFRPFPLRKIRTRRICKPILFSVSYFCNEILMLTLAVVAFTSSISWLVTFHFFGTIQRLHR